MAEKRKNPFGELGGIYNPDDDSESEGESLPTYPNPLLLPVAVDNESEFEIDNDEERVPGRSGSIDYPKYLEQSNDRIDYKNPKTNDELLVVSIKHQVLKLMTSARIKGKEVYGLYREAQEQILEAKREVNKKHGNERLDRKIELEGTKEMLAETVNTPLMEIRTMTAEAKKLLEEMLKVSFIDDRQLHAPIRDQITDLIEYHESLMYQSDYNHIVYNGMFSSGANIINHLEKFINFFEQVITVIDVWLRHADLNRRFR
jgi:hypothetical protein